ncbi:MAG TPA: ABC transporter permease [Acidimicrobiales bacterium]|nr:ABC transporter permease [Acidimicrobiales bacterium]
MEATLASIIFSASPLVYAAIGETIGEKAGVVNLSMEGTIMLSAMTAFVVALQAGNILVGFLAAAGVGAAFAAIIAFASIRLRLHQYAVGFILYLLGVSLSSFLGDKYVGRQIRGVPHFAIPGLSKIPGIGPVLFNQDVMVYGGYLLIIVATVFMYKTKRGLEMQGVGERPEAAWARGIPVNRMRYLYTIIGGALAGVAGAAYSLDVILGWRQGLTQNFGWIALAIVIFGGWNPARAAIGAYLFGALEISALKLQPVFPSLSQVLPVMPFVLMIVVLVIIYMPALRRAADRHTALRKVIAGDPPSGLATIFSTE